MKMFNCGLAILAIALMATPSHAVQLAYEGFAGIGDGTLSGTPATGSGFSGVWTITSNAGGVSTTEAAGLSYPGTYPGSHTATGGNGRATGAPSNNAFLALDLGVAAEAAANDQSGYIFVSFLGEMVGQTVSEVGPPPTEDDRLLFNLASEYPRNQGIRFNHNPVADSNRNDADGTIGKGSDWNSNGVTYGDSNPLIIDTWGAAGFNDANRIYTGADFADGTDHIVIRINEETSHYDVWVNLQADGTSDGHIRFRHTDNGTPVPLDWAAFGVEAGNNSSDRPVGDMVFDEIYIADTFYDAAGFAAPRGVPEPSSIVAVCGLIGLAGLARLRRRS